MKKTSIFFMAAFVAVFAFLSAACNNLTPADGNTSASDVSATTEANSKTVLSGSDEEGYSVLWQKGDNITIFGKDNGGYNYFCTYALNDASAGSSDGSFRWVSGDDPETKRYTKYPTHNAWYPSDFFVYDSSNAKNRIKGTWPAIQPYTTDERDMSPMWAKVERQEKTGFKHISFKNLGGIIRIEAIAGEEALTIGKVVMATDQLVSGTLADLDLGSALPQAAGISEDYKHRNEVYKTVTVNCGSEGITVSGETVPFLIALPAGEYTGVSFSFYNTAGKLICSKILKKGSNIAVNRSRITRVQLTLKNSAPVTPKDAISGVFTVNKEGRKVRFAKGNVMYQASTNTWKLAEHQYDCVGGKPSNYEVRNGNVYEGGVQCTNVDASESYSGWIDLFGWGSNGIADNRPAGTTDEYQPWSKSSTTSSTYVNYGPDAKFAGLSNENHCDWGYTISKDGKWSTLSAEEWEYVVQNHQYTYATLYADAQKTDELAKGMILIPEDYVHPSGVTALDFTKNKSEMDKINNLTLDEWNKMEAAGAVYLPACGWRTISSKKFSYQNGGFRDGYYWSTSRGASKGYAQYFVFNGAISNKGAACNQTSPCSGHAVRLVTVVK